MLSAISPRVLACSMDLQCSAGRRVALRQLSPAAGSSRKTISGRWLKPSNLCTGCCCCCCVDDNGMRLHLRMREKTIEKQSKHSNGSTTSANSGGYRPTSWRFGEFCVQTNLRCASSECVLYRRRRDRQQHQLGARRFRGQELPQAELVAPRVRLPRTNLLCCYALA